MKFTRILILLVSVVLFAGCGSGSTGSKPTDSGKPSATVKAVKPSLEFGDVCGLFSTEDIGTAAGMTVSAGKQSVSTRGIYCRYPSAPAEKTTQGLPVSVSVGLIADGAPDTSVHFYRKQAKQFSQRFRDVKNVGSDALLTTNRFNSQTSTNGVLEIGGHTWQIGVERSKSTKMTDKEAEHNGAGLLKLVAAGAANAHPLSIADIVKSKYNACSVGLDEMKRIFGHTYESSPGWNDDYTYCSWSSPNQNSVSGVSVNHPTDSRSKPTDNFTKLMKDATKADKYSVPVVLFDVPGLGDKAFVTWIDQAAKRDESGNLRGAFERDGDVTSFSLYGSGKGMAGKQVRDKVVEFMKAYEKSYVVSP